MKSLITGNDAVSTAVRLARVEVIAAYPITPQTSISEKLSLYCSEGTLDADFIMVESEHSALATVIGAASTGVRTFTATSSQGLALMHELLHWASGARLPIVMANVNRALGAPWSIWGDQTDSLAQRDTGWLQFYCESCQEVLDTTLMAFAVAETVNTPVMVMLDGFFLSHTAEPVEVPEPEEVDSFLGGRPEPPALVDPSEPHTLHAVTSPEYFMEFKHRQFKAAEQGEQAAIEVAQGFEKKFGRSYPMTENFMCADAETVLVTSGTAAGTVRHVVRKLREQGRKVGMMRVRMFRPYPFDEVREIIAGAKRVAVLERAISPGSEGVMAQELRSAAYGLDDAPRIYDFVTGLGGRDIVPEYIEQMVELVENGADKLERVNWLGLKE
ncbi:MAG: pyruvate ferredoxin oxidoreductase [Candidatus Glassbacteria bacterium]|nr:pyruvate ferredoxin oxidoreductase [Candidatus Glassbacteria bacterium]